MEQTLLQLPAQLVDFKPRADRSWRIVFETRELMGSEVATMVDNFQGEGWLLWKPNSDGIEPEELPTDVADSGIKTPGQRLRAKLFVVWKQRGGKGDFEGFYRTYVQKLLDALDEQIDT